MEVTVFCTTSPPLLAAAAAFREISSAFWELSALALILAVICSMVEAVSSIADACSCERWERSWLPAAIWLEPEATFSEDSLIWRTMSCNFPMNTLNHLANSPNSSLLSASNLLVRSPSPWAISFTIKTILLMALTMEREMVTPRKTARQIPMIVRTICILILKD